MTEVQFDIMQVPRQDEGRNLRRRAARTVASHARDAEELERLLKMLGLTIPPPEPVAAAEPEPSACGTFAGPMRHRRAGEPMCDACREANSRRQAWRKFVTAQKIRRPPNCRRCGSVFHPHTCHAAAP